MESRDPITDPVLCKQKRQRRVHASRVDYLFNTITSWPIMTSPSAFYSNKITEQCLKIRYLNRTVPQIRVSSNPLLTHNLLNLTIQYNKMLRPTRSADASTAPILARSPIASTVFVDTSGKKNIRVYYQDAVGNIKETYFRQGDGWHSRPNNIIGKSNLNNGLAATNWNNGNEVNNI